MYVYIYVCIYIYIFLQKQNFLINKTKLSYKQNFPVKTKFPMNNYNVPMNKLCFSCAKSYDCPVQKRSQSGFLQSEMTNRRHESISKTRRIQPE